MACNRYYRMSLIHLMYGARRVIARLPSGCSWLWRPSPQACHKVQAKHGTRVFVVVLKQLCTHPEARFLNKLFNADDGDDQAAGATEITLQTCLSPGGRLKDGKALLMAAAHPCPEASVSAYVKSSDKTTQWSRWMDKLNKTKW